MNLWEKTHLSLQRKNTSIDHSDTRSVQGNFDLLTSFIQDSADKHIPSKTSRSVSSIPWITPEIRRKIRRKNKTHAKTKKTGSSKLRWKFETLRREIKADVRRQHDIVVSKDGVIKLLKGLNPSKALGPDELHARVLKELATGLGPVFAHLFQQ